MSARILIIEDDRNSRELLEYLLRHGGYTPLTAAHGGAGMDVIMRDRPDLVLCDLQMPVMDGFEVLKHVRSMTYLQKLPIIAVSAFSMAGDQERAISAGFNGYFAKPIDPETFLGEMEVFLPPELIVRRE